MSTPKFFLIVNLIAGQGRSRELFPKVRAELDRRKIDYDLHYTNEPQEATDVCKMGIDAGFTHIVAMGGDGTVNEVANGLWNTEATLGVIPAGTGNDFIRMLGIPSDPFRALDVLSSGAETRIDLGCIDGDRCFVNGLGIGLDAKVAQDVLKMERLRGAPAYIYAAVKEVFQFKAFTVSIDAEDWELELPCLSVGVSNGRYAGGGFKLAPRASVTDGLIDVSAIGDFPKAQRLFRLMQARAGKHLSLPQVHYHQTTEATVASKTKLIAHVDGEPYRLPRDEFKVSVLKNALRVIVPA